MGGNNNYKNSAYECKQQCESMSNCKAYTWKTDSRQCWLKSSVSGQTYYRLSKSGTCFGGTPPTPPSHSCNGATRGLDWSNNVNIAPMGNNNIKNNAYAWKIDSRQCWLKSSVSGQTTDWSSESGTC